MPCRSGSPHAVFPEDEALALPAGANFSRAMTARITATTPRTGSSRFRMSTSARVRSVTTPAASPCHEDHEPQRNGPCLRGSSLDDNLRHDARRKELLRLHVPMRDPLLIGVERHQLPRRP